MAKTKLVIEQGKLNYRKSNSLLEGAKPENIEREY